MELILEQFFKNLNLDIKLNLIDNIFDFLLHKYNTKILNYTTKKIKITKQTETIIVMREYIFKLIKKNSSFFTNITNPITQFKEVHFVIKVNNDFLKKLFFCYTMFYNLDCLHSGKKNMIGIDFEFNSKKIALCQFGFYPMRKHKYTFILSTNTLNSQETQLLISTVFVQNYTYKIMHGSDSMDIPYIYEELFQKNTEQMFNFTKYLVDTRFLCEYFKIAIKYKDTKSSLYNALSFFNVINKKQYDELENINHIIGPIYKVKWDIYNINLNQLKYAAYDVIYLKLFVTQIFTTAKKDHFSLTKQLKFVSPIFRLWCYEKYNLSEISQYAKNITHLLNDHVVKNKPIANVFNDLLPKIEYLPLELKFENFAKINNFKKLIILIYKLVFYHILFQHYELYSQNNKLYTNIIHKINTKELHSLKLYKIVSLIEYFYETSLPVIINYLSNDE